MADSADVISGKRLLDAVKRHGFVFQRIAPGPDGPLWGVRDIKDWHDTVYIGGFATGCSALGRHFRLLDPAWVLFPQVILAYALLASGRRQGGALAYGGLPALCAGLTTRYCPVATEVMALASHNITEPIPVLDPPPVVLELMRAIVIQVWARKPCFSKDGRWGRNELRT